LFKNNIPLGSCTLRDGRKPGTYDISVAQGIRAAHAVYRVT